MIRFASLGSGSEGNGLLVQCGETLVLLDCGFSRVEAERRLYRLGVSPADLDGILVTHEHTDHMNGVAGLVRHHSVPVYGSFGTLSALWADDLAGFPQHRAQVLRCGQPILLGGLEIEPFSVPHDAREPLQFVLGDGVRRLGVLTDVGCSTPHVEAVLRCCDALFLEANYDEQMLRDGPYPQALKARVGGRFGHLSNDEAAALLGRLEHARLQHVVAAHVSQKNNTTDKARSALAKVLGWEMERVPAADQTSGLDWLSVE